MGPKTLPYPSSCQLLQGYWRPSKTLLQKNQGFPCMKALLITEQSRSEPAPRTRRVIALGLALQSELEDGCVTVGGGSPHRP